MNVTHMNDTFLICPVCGKPLERQAAAYRCDTGHAFDIARSGYVNLLRTQTSGKRHGDDKAMALARTRFLDGGYYRPLLETILESIRPYCNGRVHLLDMGCGECWYTAHVCDRLRAWGREVMALGIDISKDTLAVAGKRKADIHLAAASVSRLPAADGSVSLLLNLFAPFEPAEFARVLSPDGIWVRAVPLRRHLYGLKAAVYDRPYENQPEPAEMAGFSLLDSREVNYTFSLDSNQTIRDLFCMTPYYYKTSAADQAKLDVLTHLETEASFGVRVYRKKGSL